MLMDFGVIAVHHPTMPNSPMRKPIPNAHDEEQEVEKDIEYLERRLASAKSQLMCPTHDKNKQLVS